MAKGVCTGCGEPIRPGDHFCSSCGRDISGVQGELDTMRATPSIPLSQQLEATVLRVLKDATAGQYKIQYELGRGGMAIVYRARDLSLDRDVAIKVMSPHLSGDLEHYERMMDRFQQEAKTAARLTHVHIIPIYAVGEKDGLLYFAMKFVPGRPLDSIIKDEGPMPIGMAEEIIAQVASALDHAHRHGVIHRDVKPSNVMIDSEGHAVVTDFGIAKEESGQHSVTGTVIGTPEYMSPEQCTGRKVTPAADQYSLGVAAYEMVAGRRPIRGESLADIMFRQQAEAPPRIEQFRPDCPPHLCHAIHRMLEKDPQARFPSLDDVVTLLRDQTTHPRESVRTGLKTLAAEGVAHQLELARRRPSLGAPTEATPDSGSRPGRASAGVPPAKRKRSGPRFAVAAVVSVVAVGGGVWGYTTLVSSETPTPISVPVPPTTAEPNAPDGTAAPGTTQASDLAPEGAADSPPPPDTRPAPRPADAPAPEAAVDPQPPPPPATGRIIVTGLPPGGRILVDGLLQPSPDFEIESGRYRIELEAEGFEAATRTVTVRGGGVSSVAFPAVPLPEPEPEPPPPSPDSGTVRIVVDPRADLLLDGRAAGRGRSFDLFLQVGEPRAVRITRAGYVTIDTTIVASSTDTTVVSIRLVRVN